MATRRAQPNIQPSTLPQVIASPVNTYYSLGAGGMPAQPVQAAAPAQPFLQEARDLEALAGAFGSLSGSLAELGQAVASKERALVVAQKEREERFEEQARRLERFAEKKLIEAERLEASKEREAAKAAREEAKKLQAQAALERSAQETAKRVAPSVTSQIPQAIAAGSGLTKINPNWVDAVQKQDLLMMDSPVTHRFISQEIGESLAHSTNEQGFAEFMLMIEAQDPRLDDENAVEKFFADADEANLSSIPDYIRDPGRFAQAYLEVRSSYRNRFYREYNKYRLSKGQEREAVSVVNKVQNAVEDLIDPGVTGNLIEVDPLTGAISVVENDATLEWVDKAAARITQALDRGILNSAVLTPNQRNVLVGKTLVDAAVETPLAKDKKLILRLLDYVETGPPESRSKLKGIPEVKDYFNSKEDQIATSIRMAEERERRQAEAQAEEERKKAIEMAQAEYDKSFSNFEDFVVDSIADSIVGRRGSALSVENLKELTLVNFRDLPDTSAMKRALRNLGGELRDGKFTFTSPVNGSIKTLEVERFIEKAVANAKNNAFAGHLRVTKMEPRYQDMSPEGQSLIAATKTAKDLALFDEPAISDYLYRAVVNFGASEGGVGTEALKNGLEAFGVLIQDQENRALARSILGKSSGLFDIYSMMHSLYTDKALGDLGGGGEVGLMKIGERIRSGALGSDQLSAAADIYGPALEAAMGLSAFQQAVRSQFAEPSTASAKIKELAFIRLHLSQSPTTQEAAAAALSATMRVMESSTFSTPGVEGVAPSRNHRVDDIHPSLLSGEDPQLGRPLPSVMSQADAVLASSTTHKKGTTGNQKFQELYREIAMAAPMEKFGNSPPYFSPQVVGGEVVFKLYVPSYDPTTESGVGYRVMPRLSGTSIFFSLDEVKTLADAFNSDTTYDWRKAAARKDQKPLPASPYRDPKARSGSR